MCDIEIDIARIKFRLGEFCHDGKEQIELSNRNSTSGTLRITEFGRCRECLYFDENRSISFDRHRQGTSREMKIFLVDKFHSRIGEIVQTIFFHLKKPDDISCPKSVLKRTENAIILGTNALKKEHNIHKMFE